MISEMPETLVQFIKSFLGGSISAMTLEELGAIGTCTRCGEEILRPKHLANALVEYYGEDYIIDDVEALLEEASVWGNLSDVEFESADYEGVCSWCGNKIGKGE